jgi:integrase
VRDELLASNPAARVKRPGVPRTEAHYLSIAEVAALLDAVKDLRYARLLRLLVATGAAVRRWALRWSDVDLTNSILRVRGTLSRANGHLVISEPKTERSRRNVPLSPATVALLGGSRRAKRSSGSRRPRSGLRRASCSPRRAGLQSTPGTYCGRSAPRLRPAKALGMSGVGLHTLRH